jgi:hypothetical protein
LKKAKKETKKAAKAKDFISDAIIYQVKPTNLDDVTTLFRFAKELNFTTKYKIVTEFDPERGVAYMSNDFTSRTKEDAREILSLCANELLHKAGIEGSVVEE